MNNGAITHAELKAPRAGAIAGIVFSVLLIISLSLIRLSVPLNPADVGTWLSDNENSIRLALNLLPFAGIAFLWFIGVLRDRMGALEDRFFATVFLGSGLLFLAMLFASAAVAAGIISTYGTTPGQLINSEIYGFSRATTYELTNTYAIKMAGVFMISTSTVALYTGFAPRWIAVLGFILALVLLLGSYYISWCFIVLPTWVLLISVYILIDNIRDSDRAVITR